MRQLKALEYAKPLSDCRHTRAADGILQAALPIFGKSVQYCTDERCLNQHLLLSKVPSLRNSGDRSTYEQLIAAVDMCCGKRALQLLDLSKAQYVRSGASRLVWLLTDCTQKTSKRGQG
ncbi:unnamed protein product [Thelazia callipaeda]|uniref:Transposase n=1 Tax=Thelazia callipaeda TaxID=103827 RepID=A0A0N5DAY0_THECL|nr:unnamed protein product [Thelazia callipaeda]